MCVHSSVDMLDKAKLKTLTLSPPVEVTQHTNKRHENEQHNDSNNEYDCAVRRQDLWRSERVKKQPLRSILTIQGIEAEWVGVR